jgi:hypothetical protein
VSSYGPLRRVICVHRDTKFAKEGSNLEDLECGHQLIVSKRAHGAAQRRCPKCPHMRLELKQGGE